MMDALGWIGSFLFAVCAIPQAYKSYKDGHSDGLGWGFLLMWFFGEVLCLIYATGLGAWPLVGNYVFNFLALLVILYYKIWRKT